MTTAIDHARKVRAKFFPPAMPVARFTRAEIEASSNPARAEKVRQETESALLVRERRERLIERFERVFRQIASGEVVEPQPTGRKMMADICNEVCAKHKITIWAIKSEARRRDFVIARQELYYRCWMETPHSWVRIGLFVGGRDHTTIRHGARRHAERHGLPLREGAK